MGIFVIGLFGICAAATQKRQLIRIFAYLSALTVLIVFGISLLRIITHFTMKDTILGTCVNAAMGRGYVYGGWWGPVYSDSLSSEQFCNRSYDRDSWAFIVGMLILCGIAIVFSIIAFSYLRQSLDPSSPANAMRDPQHSGVSPAHYYPPYGASGYNAAYGQGYNYPAPAGPPPGPYPGRPSPEYFERPGLEDSQKKNDDEGSGPKV